MPIDDYVSGIVDKSLWNLLGEVLQDSEYGMRAQNAADQRVGIVLARNRLLGLAAVRVLNRTLVHVPLTQRDPKLDPDNLPTQLNRWQRNGDWHTALCDLLAEDGSGQRAAPVLIRAWNMQPHEFTTELAGIGKAPQALRAARIVYLVERPEDSALFEKHLIYNVQLDFAILANLADSLNVLPDRVADRPDEAENYLRTLRKNEDDLLAALATPGQSRFKRFVADAKHSESKSVRTLFQTRVLAEREDQPRHAAALFVASHFDRLGAGQFLELADILAMNAPAATAAAEAAKPPTHLTDTVLRECKIVFGDSGGSGQVAHFVIEEELSQSGSLVELDCEQVASNVRRQYADHAPLLKERFLVTLAGQLTLGHISAAVSQRYQELEITAISEVAKVDPQYGLQRLSRIVFGYAAFTAVGEGFIDANLPRLEAALERSVQRAQTFLPDVARQVATLSLSDIVGALCSADPVDTDERWRRIFRENTARLFWALYAEDPAAVTLWGFPAWFEDTKTALARRAAAVSAIEDILRGKGGRGMQHVVERFTDPVVLTPFLDDVATEYSQFAGTDASRSRLLLHASASLLEATLIRVGKIETDSLVVNDTADRSFLEAFAHQDVQKLLDPKLSPGDPSLDDAQYRVWLAVRTTIAAMTGSAALGELEKTVLDMWLLEQLGLDRIFLSYFSFDSKWFWLRFCTTSAPLDTSDDGEKELAEFDEAFRTAIEPILQLFPIAALLARSGKGDGFIVSPSLQSWLTEPGLNPPKRRVYDYLDVVKSGTDLQGAWSGLFEKWRFPVRNPELVRATFKARRTMLHECGIKFQAIARASANASPITPKSQS